MKISLINHNCELNFLRQSDKVGAIKMLIILMVDHLVSGIYLEKKNHRNLVVI